MTRLLREHWRGLLRLAGAAMLVAGGRVYFRWGYTYGPARRLSDPDWLRNHSQVARWAEEQKRYHRTGASPQLLPVYHDCIAYYGDKEWFRWLVARINDGSVDINYSTALVVSIMCNHSFDRMNGVGRWFEAHESQT